MKILIVHASAGAGHTKAAEALHEGLKKTAQHQVVFVDALDYCHPLYQYNFRQGYSLLVTKFPFVWGFFFWLSDLGFLRPAVKVFARLSNQFLAEKFAQLLKEEQFDYIFSTHFLSSEVAAFLKKDGFIHSKVISVVTDFDVHILWFTEGVDIFAVACSDTKKKLNSLGVSHAKIVVTGIPTAEKFSLPVNRDELKTKLGLKKDIFTVLIATGSFGIGPLEKIALALKNCQVMIVCGRNKTLFDKLSQKKSENIVVCGLVNNMHELMAVSDAMVTKPGGLSICEALVNNLPLIFINAIPGQETHNIHVLSKYGIGMEGNSIGAIAAEIEKLRTVPGYLSSAKQRTQELAKPSAVQNLINLIS